MRTFVLALVVVLIATPVFAALEVTLTKTSETTVDVGYTGADPCNPPRAFALDVQLTGSGTITLSGSYKLDGESTAASRGYGIYPARIVIDGGGNPTSYGTPLADPCDPGSGDGDGTGHIVLEFGSLYVGDINAPVVEGVTSGTLCELTIDGCVDSNMVVVAETTYRGGLLLEDGTDASASASAEIVICADVTTPTCWDNVNQCGGQNKGDANCDGGVNFIDLGLLKASIFKCKGVALYNCCADFNQDECVNFIDLGILKANIFSTGHTPATGMTDCPE